MAISKAEKARRAQEATECAQTLRNLLVDAGLAHPHHLGDTSRRVYVSVTHVARSGMSRRMRVYCGSRTTGNIVNLTHRVAKVLGWRMRDDDIVVEGCGMDMRFHLVYTLSRALYGHGDALVSESL